MNQMNDLKMKMKRKTLMLLSAMAVMFLGGCIVEVDGLPGDDGGGDTPTPTTGTINGHTWVDLGLPSGTLWATSNVGANTPEAYGDYFAWGETQPQASNTYNWSSYKYCNGSYYTLTKYCNDSGHGDNGFTDNLTTLEASDDAATANWGGAWRMPTKAEMQELEYNCTVTWTTQNGINGRLFTGPNGNSIFLPAAGYRRDGSLYSPGGDGFYWSSSLFGVPDKAWGLQGNYSVSYYVRCKGFSVRPVCSH